MAEVTPFMQQYLKIKQKYATEVLFFRLGDFYEMFNDDAIEVSRLLNLTLTQRQGVPMCGIPYRVASNYIERLLQLNKHIAICEQVGDVPQHGKELIERKVTQVITPGTVVDSQYLTTGDNNFVAALWQEENITGFSYIDVSTAKFFATQFDTKDIEVNLNKELNRAMPKEFILPQTLESNIQIKAVIAMFPRMNISYYPAWHFGKEECYQNLLEQFKTTSLAAFSMKKDFPSVNAAGFLLEYLKNTTATSVPHIKEISFYMDYDFLVLDESTKKNLEINTTMAGEHDYTLMSILNQTKTAMGHRLLSRFLMYPLCNVEKIKKRQDDVALFFNDMSLLKNTRSTLAQVLDIERLAGRIAMQKAHAKDMVSLRFSLEKWCDIACNIKQKSFDLYDTTQAMAISNLIKTAIKDLPSIVLQEGNIIRPGYSVELDHLYKIKNDFNQILQEYLQEEIKKTGIENLRIRFMKNIGYYMEVTKSKQNLVPEYFIMRRSLTNAARYTTQKLEELEAELNSASEKIIELECDLYIQLRSKIAEYVPYLMNIASNIAYMDVISSFAHIALVSQWVKPEVDNTSIFSITAGRHPVVEANIPIATFVPNDIDITSDFTQNAKPFILLTGPNMAGKSTYLRQNAIIALLAHLGSFVPATEAHIGVLDRIFCRVGASDNLAKGESTFLVEMTEVAHILRFATQKSLVIMDEVGRGTSTQDGLAIAQAIAEHLLNKTMCKTLFATHYHELAQLEHPRLKQCCMQVMQNENEVVFLKKVTPGASLNSYGIYVASISGVPQEVIQRAKELLEHIQQVTNMEFSTTLPPSTSVSKRQDTVLDLFNPVELITDEIKSIDCNNITPMQALKILLDLQKKLLS